MREDGALAEGVEFRSGVPEHLRREIDTDHVGSATRKCRRKIASAAAGIDHQASFDIARGLDGLASPGTIDS